MPRIKAKKLDDLVKAWRGKIPTKTEFWGIPTPPLTCPVCGAPFSKCGGVHKPVEKKNTESGMLQQLRDRRREVFEFLHFHASLLTESQKLTLEAEKRELDKAILEILAHAE